MIRLFKNTLLLAFFTLFSCKATAQKFTTHKVKKGESLEQLAKDYAVVTDDILAYNKEISVGEPLAANTILVIPQDKAKIKTDAIAEPKRTVSESVARVSSETEANVEEVKDDQEEPYGFTSHKVKRRETLYSIAKRYNITEESIKKYNRELYSTQLAKRMVLRIPKYRRADPNDKPKIDPNDYEMYTVSAKETRWSIANKYGITIDSILSLNPSLSKSNNYLGEGQTLKLPKRAGLNSQSNIEEEASFISYTVPAKMNFYQLEKKFGVTSDELMKLNPEIVERGGLKEDMVIRIPDKKKNTGAINTDNFIFYEVKPKQTEYSLTRKLGMSYRELLQLNPALKDGLKAGMVLKLPKKQTGDFDVRNSLVLDKVNLLDSINPSIKPKVLFLLPFRLDRMDMADAPAVESTIKKRNDVAASLGLYSGALVALDSIADLGISIDVKALDNELKLAKTKEIMARENLSDYNAIFGPLDPSSMQEVAKRAASAQVPVIAPIPVRSLASMPSVFFTYTQQKVLREKMFSYMDSLAIEKNIIVIADSVNNKVADMIMKRFPEARKVELLEEEKNISMDLEVFTELLSTECENWVFVETDNERLVPSVSSILNSNNTKETKVRMFTTNRNKAFENDAISVSHLSNLNFTYPSVYREVKNNSFVKRYEKRFGNKPDRFAVRGFDITYDLLLKLAYKNDLFAAASMVGETEYNGNKFNYEKDRSSGYFNTSAYIMTYQNMRIKQLKP